MQRVFTVPEVAKICQVAPCTIHKWFDSGRIKGYRILGTHDVRIPREHLVDFLQKYGMPSDVINTKLGPATDIPETAMTIDRERLESKLHMSEQALQNLSPVDDESIAKQLAHFLRVAFQRGYQEGYARAIRELLMDVSDDQSTKDPTKTV